MGHQVVAVCDEVTGTSLAGVEEILRACGGKRRLCERERERELIPLVKESRGRSMQTLPR